MCLKCSTKANNYMSNFFHPSQMKMSLEKNFTPNFFNLARFNLLLVSPFFLSIDFWLENSFLTWKLNLAESDKNREIIFGQKWFKPNKGGQFFGPWDVMALAKQGLTCLSGMTASPAALSWGLNSAAKRPLEVKRAGPIEIVEMSYKMSKALQ